MKSPMFWSPVYQSPTPDIRAPRHACLLGCEGIVSKRKNSRYRSGRSRDWVKSKNPAAPAVTVAVSARGQLILKRAWASRPSASEGDYDVFTDGIVVGGIMRAIVAPAGSPWFRRRWLRSRKAVGGNEAHEKAPPSLGRAGPKFWESRLCFADRRVGFGAAIGFLWELS